MKKTRSKKYRDTVPLKKKIFIWCGDRIPFKEKELNINIHLHSRQFVGWMIGIWGKNLSISSLSFLCQRQSLARNYKFLQHLYNTGAAEFFPFFPSRNHANNISMCIFAWSILLETEATVLVILRQWLKPEVPRPKPDLGPYPIKQSLTLLCVSNGRMLLVKISLWFIWSLL